MLIEHVAELFTNARLSATHAECADVAADIYRLSHEMAQLKATLKKSENLKLFSELLKAAKKTKFKQAVRLPGDQRRESNPTKTISPFESIATANALNPTLNCFIEIFKLDGCASNHISPNSRTPAPNRQTLLGVPFAYKDMFVSAERHPTNGVGAGYAWPGRVVSRTLTRLKAAGAVAIGATNLDPHCYAATGLNPFLGRTLNPRGTNFAVGGSSGGSSAAVAAGIVPFAIGSDTGGSVRIPASFCGVYGFKPSSGLLADKGFLPLSQSQDTVGLVSSTAEFMAKVLQVLAPRFVSRQTQSSPQSKSYQALNIGVDAAFMEGLDQDVAQVFEHFKIALQHIGALIVNVQLPCVHALNDCASVMTGFEANLTHRDALSMSASSYPAVVRRRLLTAACISKENYLAARRLRGKYLQSVLTDTFSKIDYFLCPTVRCIAPNVQHLAENDLVSAGSMSLEFLRLSRPFSFLGLPALSVPSGFDRNGIPVGMQLVGKPYADFELIDLAIALEQRNCKISTQ